MSTPSMRSVSEPSRDPTQPLYQKVATEVSELISTGTYEPGERLPSIRDLAQRMGVSINTVREAYGLLESRGVVGARSQSGHYVLVAPLAEPDFQTPDLERLGPAPITGTEIAYAVIRDAKREGWCNLGASEPPPGALPAKPLAAAATRVLRRATEIAAYDFAPGCYQLRQNIARRMVDNGWRGNADEIILTSGCMEAVFLALSATCRRGETVLIESPTFHLFHRILDLLELKALEVPASAQTGISLPAVEFALRHHQVAAMLVIPNFSNPLGALMPDGAKQELVELGARFGVPIIEDDIYGELAFDGSRPHSLVSLPGEATVIHCSSFSKTVAPGYRVGWVIGGSHYETIRRTKTATSMGVSTPAENILTELLESGAYDRHLRWVRRYYRDVMIRMTELVATSFPPGTRVSRPRGGMVLWVVLPEGHDAVRLYALAREERVVIAPGAMYTLGDQYRNCLRLNATQITPQIEHAVRLLGKLAVQATAQSGDAA